MKHVAKAITTKSGIPSCSPLVEANHCGMTVPFAIQIPVVLGAEMDTSSGGAELATIAAKNPDGMTELFVLPARAA